MNWPLILTVLVGPACLLAQHPLLQPQTTERGIEAVGNYTDHYGNGAAVADFDGDGDLDFYLPTDAGIPDRLYRNDGRGHFTDVAEQLGLGDTVANRTALWLDYDGDHRLDLVVAGENCVNLSCTAPIHLALYRQTATGDFTEVTAASGLLPAAAFTHLRYYAIGGLTAGDVNGDHYLDLLLTVWGGGIQLFLNNTDGTFRDATAQLGLTLSADTPWQALMYDFDGDGRQDIYCNIDFDANKLWINQGNGFIDRAWDYGLDGHFNEMGIAVGDYDNDGALDLYLTNITRRFNGLEQYNLLLTPVRKGGKLYYRETARSAGVSQSGWDWGTTFADLDNDGRQDLVATNGWWDNYAYYPDSSRAWQNTPVGFVDVSATWGFQDTLPATTLLAFDMDRDGDLDLLQTLKDNTVTSSPAILYENQREELPGQTNYINLQPRMPGANHYAIGSVVTVMADELTSARLLTAGSSFYGQEPAEAHFGLGTRTEINEVHVRWPQGHVTVHPGLTTNTTHVLPYRYLPPPTDLQATATDGGIQLNWQSNNADEQGFELQRSVDSTFSTFVAIAVPADRTAVVDSVGPGTTYYYRVRSRAEAVYSAESNSAEASLPLPTQTEMLVVTAHPSPVSDGLLRLQMTGTYAGTVQYRLFDSAGRQMWRASDEKLLYRETFAYRLDLAAGVYFLQSMAGEQVCTLKVLINGPQ